MLRGFPALVPAYEAELTELAESDGNEYVQPISAGVHSHAPTAARSWRGATRRGRLARSPQLLRALRNASSIAAVHSTDSSRLPRSSAMNRRLFSVDFAPTPHGPTRALGQRCRRLRLVLGQHRQLEAGGAIPVIRDLARELMTARRRTRTSILGPNPGAGHEWNHQRPRERRQRPIAEPLMDTHQGSAQRQQTGHRRLSVREPVQAATHPRRTT